MNSQAERITRPATDNLSRSEPIMRDLHDFFRREIKPILSIANVFGAYARERQGMLRAWCPSHGDDALIVRRDTCEWQCSIDGERGGPIAFLYRAQGGKGPPNREVYLEVIEELAARCGVCPPMQSSAAVAASSEAERLWKFAHPLDEDTTAARWFEALGLNPITVVNLDLVRALPQGIELPRWAGFEIDGHWYPWPCAGRRLVIPLINRSGRIHGLKFFGPFAIQEDARSRSGSGETLVMADAIASLVLATGQPPAFWGSRCLTIIVTAGVHDFLSVSAKPASSSAGTRGCPLRPVIAIQDDLPDSEFFARFPPSTRFVSAIPATKSGDRQHGDLKRMLSSVGRGFSLSDRRIT